MVGSNAVAIVQADTVGTFTVQTLWQSDRSDGIGGIAGAGQDLTDVIMICGIIQLIQQQIPCFIVEVLASKTDKCQIVLLLFLHRICRVDIAALDIAQPRVRSGVEGVLLSEHINILLVDRLAGDLLTEGQGCFPVGTGEHNHLIVHVLIHIGEEIGRSDEACLGVSLCPLRHVKQRTIVIHCSLHFDLRGARVALIIPDGLAVVPVGGFDYFMAVPAQGQDVLTFLQYVAARRSVAIVAGVAVGCHLIPPKAQHQLGALAGLQETGLGKGDQRSGGLFDLHLPIQIRVGRIQIKLYHFLACPVTCIGHRDSHF